MPRSNWVLTRLCNGVASSSANKNFDVDETTIQVAAIFYRNHRRLATVLSRTTLSLFISRLFIFALHLKLLPAVLFAFVYSAVQRRVRGPAGRKCLARK